VRSRGRWHEHHDLALSTYRERVNGVRQPRSKNDGNVRALEQAADDDRFGVVGA
jgi:hypothetical protein